MSVTKSLRVFALIAVLISTGYAATGTINTNTRYQQIEGFGAAVAWYQNHLLYHQKANELYDLLFDELGLDIYRVRNTYNQGPGGTDYMNQTGQIVAAAKQRNPNLKVLISSWSPPASLKSNNSTSGGGNATLAKSGGQFVYGAFADWWANSITAWAGYGVNADYISIQNEPDFDATWDSCRFNPTQTSSIAGYNVAFEAVYNELNSRFGSSMPKMLAPETTGFYGASGHSLHNYLTAITNHSHVYGYCHHLYNIDAGDNPDAYLTQMTNFNSSWGSKPLFQTEYEKSTDVWPDAYNLALLLHNSLAVEQVSGYLYWDLVWQDGGLVTIPSHGASTYTINSDFYGLKHYSAFISPGWRRVAATTNSYPNLRITAFINPDEDELTAVIINTHSSSTIGLDLSFQGFIINSGSVYRTTSTQNCVPIGTYNGTGTLSLPAKSVTTLSLSVTLGSIWLNTSSGPNGSVTVPGEGDFIYIKDTYADISATPDRFYEFSHWSGSAVSAGKVADPYDANTTVFMDTNYSVIANFNLGPVDTTPPTPNPMTWAVEPVASGSTSITMVATTATDESDPVQYYFYCVTDPSKSSSWQSSTTYTATDLNPMTSYSFMVKARDSYLTPNETAYSVAKAATTQTPLSTIHILDEWVTGDSIDIQAGPDRVLVLIAHAEYGNTNITLDSVTYGGQPMIKVDEIMVGTFARAYAAAFILPESNIVLASDNMFVPTWSSEPSHTAYSSAFFEGVDQYNIVGASAKNSHSSSSPATITTSELATDEGNMVILGATCGNPGVYTLNNGFTGITLSFDNQVTGAAGHKAATGVPETPSVTHNSPNRQVILGFVLQSSDFVDEPPAAPTGLTATAGNNLVSLDWDDNTEPDLAGYNIYRSETQGGGYSKINPSVVIDSDYIDYTAENWTTYYYVVKAVDNGSNESGYSNEASAMPAYQSCADVHAGGDGLVSDINKDCYVNTEDLAIIVQYWLETDCASYNDDCYGADLTEDGKVNFADFGDFAIDWLNCNDPTDGGCVPNWP